MHIFSLVRTWFLAIVVCMAPCFAATTAAPSTGDIMAPFIARQTAMREKYFKALPISLSTLIEQTLREFGECSNNVRLPSTLDVLITSIKNQKNNTAGLSDALALLERAAHDGSFPNFFFGDMYQPAPDAPVWGRQELAVLLPLLQKTAGSEAAILATMLEKLRVGDYAAAARAAYGTHDAALATLEKTLKMTSSQLTAQLTVQKQKQLTSRDALIFWTKQINKHLQTVRKMRKAGTMAGLDLRWLLLGLSHFYDVLQPYFQLYGQFSLHNVLHPPLWQDMFMRTGIAYTAMAQNDIETAKNDITLLIMGDGSLVQQVDPLNEGVGLFALGGILGKLQKMGNTVMTVGQAFINPTMFGTALSPVERFALRFGCAFAWYNLVPLLKTKSFENHAVTAALYRSVLRYGLLELEAHVSGSMEKLIYDNVSAERLYQIENATMGIIAPQLVSEFVDMCVTGCLMQRHEWVEKHIVQFNDADIHQYKHAWYLRYMFKSAEHKDDAAFEQFLAYNQQRFYEYSALYYVFGSVGRYWARKGAAAHAEVLGSCACKVGSTLASYVLPKKYADQVLMSKEQITGLLHFVLQDVMTPGGALRYQAITFLQSKGFLPADLCEGEQVNEMIVKLFTDHFLFYGIFDYHQAVACAALYETHKDDMDIFIPRFIGSVGSAFVISFSGFLGRHAGYKVAECFFSKPVEPV